MGLVDDIKNQAKKSGTNKGKFIYFKPGNKVRVRFLQDMEDGLKVPFHDSFAEGVNEPCQELFGRKCSNCDNESLRHRDQYMWSVWDYEAKEVKLILGPVNNASPVPGLVGMYEAYGTLMDRDYVLTKNGSGTTSSFSIVPMDKAKFRNDKAKPYSKSKALDLLDKAFPHEGSSGGGSSKDDDEDDTQDYSSMSAKELYELCKERDIEVETKKKPAYYIEKLEEYDASNDDGDDEDGWGDDDDKEDEVDYSSMSAKELYTLCKERGIDVETKKPEQYYIKKLKAADEEGGNDEWDDDEDDMPF